MSSSRESANPLRPYYIPPSIGLPPNITSGTHGLGPKNGSAASYASSARDMFSDMDYSDFMSEASPSTYETVQRWINNGLHTYTNVLLCQPFDVAKMILQVRSVEVGNEIPTMEKIRSRPTSYRNDSYSNVRNCGSGVKFRYGELLSYVLWYLYTMNRIHISCRAETIVS
jgi:fusion and transport protein UGO1